MTDGRARTRGLKVMPKTLACQARFSPRLSRIALFAFICGAYEDPVTGSLNASLAQWLIGAGLSPSAYVAAQGTAMQRAGRVHLRKSGNDVWVGGDVADCIEGEVDF